MFSKAVMILSFLVIQLFSTQTVQAQTTFPGFSNWDATVKQCRM